MKSFRAPLFLLLTFFTLTLTSCDAIIGIFKAGAYTGIIAAVIVVALVLWLISKMRGGNRV
jgi:succinate-acetate transporter protein